MTIRTGLTLYSLTNEFWTGAYDLNGLLDQVAERNLGPGVEIVGFQSIPTYPEVTDDFVTAWRDGLDRRGLVASCLSSNIDIGALASRDLTEDEMVDYLTPQIIAAERLGFPVIRIQIGAAPGVIERVLPIAERAGVVLGMEIHAPESPRSELIERVIELYDRLDSPYLGFVPDFSSTMRGIPPRWIRKCVEETGIPSELVPTLTRIWQGDEPMGERMQAWMEAGTAAGVDADKIAATFGTFSMFGHEDVSVWRDIADRIVHVHGKFYEITGVPGGSAPEASGPAVETGVEPSIDYPAHIAMLEDIGYDGFISSEWEGHTLFDMGETLSFDQVAAQQALIRSCLSA